MTITVDGLALALVGVVLLIAVIGGPALLLYIGLMGIAHMLGLLPAPIDFFCVCGDSIRIHTNGVCRGCPCHEYRSAIAARHHPRS